MGDDAALVMQRKEHAIGWIAGADVCHVAGLLEALTPYGIHPSMGGEEEERRREACPTAEWAGINPSIHQSINHGIFFWVTRPASMSGPPSDAYTVSHHSCPSNFVRNLVSSLAHARPLPSPRRGLSPPRLLPGSGLLSYRTAPHHH